jgi:osmoprotectant transport system permease protein
VGGLGFLEYLRAYQDELVFETFRHAALSAQVLLVAALLGVLVALLVYRRTWVSDLAVSTSVIAFTIPSLALFGLMQPITGIGLATVFPVLVVYALLPVIRNTVVGLRGVDPHLVDVATGLGMTRFGVMLRVELPLAWPVILAGIRTSAQLTIGIAALGAFFGGAGLGGFLFHALGALGSVNTFNEALAATLLIALLGLLFDAVFLIVRLFTTPRGIRV